MSEPLPSPCYKIDPLLIFFGLPILLVIAFLP
jgi:hypothetical protein